MSVLKAKKGKGGVVELLDEDDPELLEAERQRQLEAELAAKASTSPSPSSTKDDSFAAFYEALLNETRNPKELHVLPKHSRLNNLLHHVKTAEQAEMLPILIEQWRNKRLPITPYTSTTLIHVCCAVKRADVAYTLLGERQRFGLLPVTKDFETTIATLCEQGDLDKAFITLAMVPLYDLKRTGAMYQSLLDGCLAAPHAEGEEENDHIRKAAMTAEELVSSGAQEIEDVASAKDALQKVASTLLERGEGDKAKSLQNFLSSL